MTLGSPCIGALHSLRPKPAWIVFRMLLNQVERKGNSDPVAGSRKTGIWLDQQAASANSVYAGSSATASLLCGQPERQALAQGPKASSMMDWMVRAQRPHSALQPRQS